MIQFTVSFEGKQFKSDCQSFKKIQDYIDKLISTLKLSIQNKQFGLFMNGVELQRDKTFTENKIKNGVLLELKVTKTFEYAFLKVVKQGGSYWPHISLAEKAQLLYNECSREFNIKEDSFTLYFQGVPLERQVQLAQYNIISNSIITCENNDVQKSENQIITAKIIYNNQEYSIPINKESLVSDLEQKIQEKFFPIQNFQLFKDGVQQLQSNQKINTLNAKYFQVSLQQQQILSPQNIVIFINYLNQNTPLEIASDTQIQELIETIEQIYQIKENIVLKLNDQILSNNQTVGQLKIQKGSILTVEIQKQQILPPQNIVIFINYLNQNTSIEIASDTIIQELIETVVDVHKIQENIVLKLNDQILSNDQTVGQLKIQKGSILTVEIQKQQILPPQNIVIFINYLNQNTPLEIASDTIIQELIETVVDLHKIQENIVLKLNDQILSNNQTVGQLKIQKGSILTVEIQKQQILPPQNIVIFINYLNQNTPIEIASDTQIQELIETIVQIYQIKENIVLKLKDQMLPSNQTIGQLQISNNSQITVEIQKQQILEQDLKQPQQPQQLSLIVFLDEQQSIKVDVNDDAQVQELAVALQKQYKMSQIQFKLQNGQILNPNQTFRQQNILKGQILNIQEIQQTLKQNEQAIQDLVLIIQFENNVFQVVVPANSLIQQLEQQLISDLKLQNEVKLFFNDQMLNSNETFQKNYIVKGSKLIAKCIASQPIQNIKLNLIYESQEPIFVEVQDDTIIQEIENLIIDTFKLKKELVTKWNGEVLDSLKSLRQISIKSNSKLFFQQKQAKILKLFIQIQDQTIEYEAQEDTETQQLIDNVANFFQISPSFTLQTESGNILQQNQTLQNQGLHDQAVLFLIKNEEKKGKLITLIIDYQGTRSSIQVLDSALVQEVNIIIKGHFQIEGQIQLNLEGNQILNQNDTLSNQKVQKGSILYAQVVSQAPQYFQNTQANQNPLSTSPINNYRTIQVTIDVDGKHNILELMGNILVSELLISLKQQFNINQQISLSLEGKQILQPNLTIAAQNVSNGSVLYLVPAQNYVNQSQNQVNQNQVNPPIQGKEIIIIFDNNGRKETMSVQDDILVKELIEFLQQSFQIKEQFQLRLEGNQLLNEQLTLAAQNVQKGNNLFAVFNQKPQPQIQQNLILILRHQNVSQQIEASPDSLGAQLHGNIQKQFNIQGSFQIFVEGKVPLDLNKSLKAQNLQKGNVLQVVQQFPVQQIQPFPYVKNNYQQPQINNNNTNNQQPLINNFWNQKLPSSNPNIQNNMNNFLLHKQNSFPSNINPQGGFGFFPQTSAYGQQQQVQSSQQQNPLYSSQNNIKQTIPQQQNQQYYQQQNLRTSLTQQTQIGISLNYMGKNLTLEAQGDMKVADLEEFSQIHFEIQQSVQIERQGQVLNSQQFLYTLGLQNYENLNIVTQQQTLNLEISVQGNDIQVEIDSGMKVFELIDELKLNYNINCPTELIYNQKQLMSEKTFKEQNVVNNSYLILKNRLQSIQKIKFNSISNSGLQLMFVKVRDGNNLIQIEIAPTADIQELERRFKEKTGWNFQCRFQSNNGMVLIQKQTLAQQGINNNDEVILIRG